MKADHERVKALLAESITVLCKNGLQYRTKFTIQGLLGITLDDEDIFLVDIHEKVGENKTPEPTDKSSEHRPPGAKNRRKEHGSHKSKRRRKSGSDNSRSPSPVSGDVSPNVDFDVSGIERVSVEQSNVFEESTLQKDTESISTKETSNTTAEQCALDMGVEQILELAKDIPPWPGNGSDDEQSRRIDGDTSGTQTDETAGKIVVKTEDEDIVFVKQEHTDPPTSRTVQSRTRRPVAETFTRASFGDSAGDAQADFGTHGPFRHAQPFPSPPDLSFTQGPSTSQSDSFQGSEQGDTATDASQGGPENPGVSSDVSVSGRCKLGSGKEDQMQVYDAGYYLYQTTKGMASHVDRISSQSDSSVHSWLMKKGEQRLTGDPKKKHQCPYCTKSFDASGMLKRHVRIHTGERPFVCKLCGNRFAVSHHLKQHWVRHTGEKPYACDICDRAFARLSQMKTHKLSQHRH